MERIFIGVAWPYANGPMHLGHLAGVYLPADIFSRFHRLNGNEVLMVSGSDMHGTPITVTAQQQNKTPEEVALHYHQVHSETLKQMGIEFDNYTNTHTPEHADVVRELLGILEQNDYITTKTTEEPYDPKSKHYLPDRYVEGTCPHCQYESARGDQCDDCGRTLDAKDLINPHPKLNPDTELEFRETEHLFFKLSNFRDELLAWVSKDKEHWRDNVGKFTHNWLQDGLIDRAITRDLDWGIEIDKEGYENKRIYVWFEAVMGYYSASRSWAKWNGEPDAWKKWWEDDDARHYYFLAKDNIPFHTIIWPAILMGCNLHLPYDVPANEYLLLDFTQFSKSRNHAVWAPDYLNTYDPEALRYVLSAVMPENRDSNFSWEDYVARINNELIGNLGNFIHRTISFAQKNFPKGLHSDECSAPELKDKVALSYSQITASLSACKFKESLQTLMELSQAGNIAMNEMAPWKSIKEDKKACEADLVTLLNVCRALSIIMNPFLPKSSQKVWDYLGLEGTVEEAGWGAVAQGQTDFKLNEPLPLFQKLNLEEILEREMPNEEETLPDLKPEITFEDFQKMDIRIGTVVGIENHPNADKLYLLDVDFGGPKRRIVTGLKEEYNDEELMGKQIAVIVNLAPAKFRGEVSEGMLLAAEDEHVSTANVSLLHPDKEVTDGSSVH